MARDETYEFTTNGWKQLLASLGANAEDFQHLEIYRLQLEEALAQVQDATSQQAAHEAAKRAETQRLQANLINGRKVATFLRQGVRRCYGDGSAKLAEFDLLPIRGRVRPEEASSEDELPPASPIEATK